MRGERERMLHVVGLLESEEIETFSTDLHAVSRGGSRVIIIHIHDVLPISFCSNAAVSHFDSFRVIIVFSHVL